MNSSQDSQNTENFAEEIEVNDSLSIDDFIKKLEAKEKDLHIGEVLTEMGVQPIISVGEVFDPHLHEAVATEETKVKGQK